MKIKSTHPDTISKAHAVPIGKSGTLTTISPFPWSGNAMDRVNLMTLDSVIDWIKYLVLFKDVNKYTSNV